MTKRTRFLIAGMLAALALAAVAGGALAAKTVNTKAKLKGNEVVPGPGENKGKGEALVDIKKKKRKVCFDIEFQKIGRPDLGELRKGAEGEKGPQKIVFFEEETDSPASGCVKKVKKKLLKKLVNHPENFYVQLDTTAFPEGAIRGQLELLNP
jgi:hypothetical protein